MLVVILALLYVVVPTSHGLDLARAEYSPDRFDKRVPSRNDSVTAVITSTLDVLAPSLSATSSETYENPIDSVSNTTSPLINDVSLVVAPSKDNTPSKFETGWTINNLGTITTIARPTLVLPTSTPTRGSSSTLTSSTTSSSSSVSSTDDETSSPIPPPISLNVTSKSWGWNISSSASSLSTPPVSLLPPTVTSSSLTVTSTPSECPAQPSGPIVVTSYSIVHTSTITWTGDPIDYTPPYPSITTPIPCTPNPTATGRFTITFCDGSGGDCSLIHTSTGDLAAPTTVTLTTTDKNPAVVFPTEPPPGYGGAPSGPMNHDTAANSGSVVTPEYGMRPTNIDSAKSSPVPTGNNAGGGGRSPVTVVVQPGEVIVGDATFTDGPTQETSTVIVGGDTFVIDPTQVIGAGAIVNRPPSDVGGMLGPTPAPITTSIGGLGVVYGPSIATIDGTVFTIEPTPTVAVIQGQTITIGPAGIVFPSQTLHVAAGPGIAPTQTAVLGGELITAIGSDKVVIEGTTITYGPGSGSDPSGTTTTVIDGETVLIGPSGVIVHGQTIGGTTAGPSVTKYIIAGGATVTQMGLTAVEISGMTFHVGRGAETEVTTVIDGHTLTIGPGGVGMSTWTLGSPYASTTTLMPGHGGSSNGNGNNAAMTIPSATGSPENKGGSVPRPDQSLFWIGVGCLGQMIFWL
ncbi:uncharacterized protein F4822DRAFT_318035 [Hypoxylon trugodes]|uniref:uncharacterized protein n=1 Tax=Hypoxylon trugodes TaxID=326681 RepID=UPI0021A20FA5|nr:uncharacterized protein F4822DRAFT_318035 [Hypoxylon trugodes]KAI1386485.1 hypothetical protein F4822DRAFT_318035 [Hypoxylon trugodes]